MSPDLQVYAQLPTVAEAQLLLTGQPCSYLASSCAQCQDATTSLPIPYPGLAHPCPAPRCALLAVITPPSDHTVH